MKLTTTLNVSPDLHRIVKVQAAEKGWKIGDFADSLIEVGLKHVAEATEILEKRKSVALETKK